MRKILILVLTLSTLFSLCGCGKQSSSTNSPNYSSAVSQTASISVNDSDYQSYTVDDNGNILDSKTGALITNEELAVDSNGNIILKENKQVVVTSEQVQENKKTYSSSKTENKNTENSSEAKKVSSSPASKTPSSATSKPAVSTKPKPHSEPIPLDKVKNWDSLYGKKEWILFNDEPSRQRYEGSTAFVCRFTAGQDSYATITVESLCLLDKWKYPLNDDNVVRTINGQKYVQTFWCEYKGSLYTFVGSEDVVTLELRCYDGTGRNWLSDELKFKRTENNSLQLTSGDYSEFGLKRGDVFTR